VVSALNRVQRCLHFSPEITAIPLPLLLCDPTVPEAAVNDYK